ncbi:hypothetical protein NON08_09160 [Cetobacterium somerae]|uniref:hypothetical protein n=1 Tax=Cetobacterium sp. NK01 TaxID=2993530 RepID=UPI0021162D25|nr:hypothetical protein [Cetobacterium sp. NK01]MCQ8212686.1 hypothetical protein [Cetobacterium sp. NK01]
MLKFITEEYLRDLYKKEPFQNFQIKEDQRLTPGGRQYLLDRKIEIKLFKENAKESQVVLDKKDIYKLKSLEMEIYFLTSELLSKDIKSTNEILEIGKFLKNVIDTLEGKSELLKFQENLPHIESLNPNESYLYFKNGKYIFLLKKIIFELKICKEEILKKIDIVENLDQMIFRMEKVVLRMMEEL